MRRLPSLRAVHYFESAARNLSFTRASDELNVTEAAVSHQIRYLEEELGVKLFTRTHQRIDLTPEGAHLLETATDVLDRLADAVASIAVQSANDRLHIDVTPLISAYWLMPRLSQFTNGRKHTEVILHHSLEPPHDRLDRASVKIFWGKEFAGYERDALFTDYLVPMCNRTCFETLKGKSVKDAMASVDFVHEFDRKWWATWCRAEGIDPLVIQKGTIVDDPGALESAVMMGHGMILGSLTFLRRRIDAGEIVVPFGVRSPIEIPYCLLTRPAELKRRVVREFRTWLLSVVAKETPAIPPVLEVCPA